MRTKRGGRFVAGTFLLLASLAARGARAETAPAPLRLGAAPSSLRFTTEIAAFDRTFVLSSDDDKASLNELSVQVDLLDGEKRLLPVECSLGGQPCDVKLSGNPKEALLHIKALLPAAGAYGGNLRALAPSTQASGAFSLSIERAQPKLGVEVSGIDTKLGQYCPLPGCDDFVNLWVALRETAGAGARLNAPTIVALSFKGANDAHYQSDYMLETTDEAGKALNWPLELAPGETRRVRLAILGIDAAGTYGGKLRLSGRQVAEGAGSIAAADANFSAVVKEPWFVAFLFILIGVLAGEGMRQYRRALIPRYEAGRALLLAARRYLERPGEPPPDWCRQALEVLRARVDEQLELLEQGVVGEEPLVEQLALYHRWAPLQTLALRLPEAARAPFRPALEAVRTALLEAPNRERIAAADKALGGVDEGLRAATNAEAKARIDALLANIEGLEKASAGLDPVELGAMREGLNAAKAKVDADEPAAATALYEEATLRYARLVATVLENSLATLPEGFITEKAWRELKDEIAPALRRVRDAADAATAIVAQADARRTWLKGLTTGLRHLVDARIAHASDPGASVVRDRLEAARKQLESSREQLERGDLDAAAAAYAKARDEYAESKPKEGMMDASGAVQAPTRLPLLRALGPLVLAGRTSEQTFGTRLQALRRKTSFYGFWFFVASAAIATLSGVQVLWAGDATWGGWGARILALFWGLGLHQASGALVQGVEGLRVKIDGTRPA
jgi:hypothetical protein